MFASLRFCGVSGVLVAGLLVRLFVWGKVPDFKFSCKEFAPWPGG